MWPHHLLPRHYNNLAKRIAETPKAFFLNAGLACYLTGLINRLINNPCAEGHFRVTEQMPRDMAAGTTDCL